jgi:hypothetical protein
VPFAGGDDDRIATFYNGDNGIRCAEINANNFAHGFLL